MLTNGHTVILAEALASLTKEDVPTFVWEKTGLAILDTLGAMFAGSVHASSYRLMLETIDVLGSKGNCTIVGKGNGFSPVWAALVNGVAAHGLDLDDSHRYATGYHPGATVLPACLVIAELTEASLEDLRLAVLIGYEAAGRIGRAINPSHRYRGFHSTGTVGVFGAAAGAAKVLGLNAEQFAWALGIAGSMSGGVFEFLNGMAPTKHLHAGHAAMAGVLAAVMAQKGFSGPTTILEGEEGFFKAYTDDARIEEITKDLGKRFEMEAVYFKPYAACGHSFSAIDAALELRNKGIRPEEVNSILVNTYKAAAVLSRQNPTTLHQGEFSIPFLVSLALHRGSCNINDVEKGLKDKDIIEFAKKVTISESKEITDNFPKLRSAVLTVKLQDDSTETVRIDLPRGMPENPLSSDELTQKFHQLTDSLLGKDNATRVKDAILNVEGNLKEILTIPIITDSK
ncbi:MmgE/PrpD family protein [Tepidibacillus sp. HK-1]|uniref:MmgE/PrpD family protein n=1 Tax=Tepidibacillus sp. HK-1 TaxID=1883407 RepID=UPI000853E00A|nr:MmgE/PrpD family protein [Tepidibacillus sp. HK-1]GBF12238.1 2-methylcitrate dehydratase [Tepidibacillus sp. HK-1]